MAKRSVLSTLHLVAAVERGGAQPLRAVGTRGAGEDRELHASSNDRPEAAPAKMGAWPRPRAGRFQHSSSAGGSGSACPGAACRGSRPRSTRARGRRRCTPSTSRSSTRDGDAVGALLRAPVAGLRRGRRRPSSARSTTGARCAARRGHSRSGTSCSLDLALAGRTVTAEMTLSKPRRDGLPDAGRPRGAAPGFLVDPAAVVRRWQAAPRRAPQELGQVATPLRGSRRRRHFTADAQGGPTASTGGASSIDATSR